MKAALVLLGGIWGITLWRDSSVWLTSAEYAYGFAVPFLAAFLLKQRWHHRPAPGPRPSGATIHGILTGAGTSWIVANLALAPFPDWPAALWVLNTAAIVISLALAGIGGGAPYVRHFAFPLGFILTAFPLPAVIHHGMIDQLAPWLTAVATTITNELIAPAVRHGNTIELATGVLGVNDACAGLRSIESSLMVALFLGEWFCLRRPQRWGLTFAGIGAALLGNLIRIIILTSVAAAKSVSRVETYHDAAGFAAMAVTLVPLFWLGRRLRQPDAPGSSTAPLTMAGEGWLATGLLVATLAVGAVFPLVWFSPPAPETEFAVHLPSDANGFRATPFPTSTVALLGCSEGSAATWLADGQPRAAYVARWRHGRNARFALALHTPAICLPLSGADLKATLPPVTLSCRGRPVSFTGWEFADARGRFVVYRAMVDSLSFAPLPPSPEGERTWIAWRIRDIADRRRDEYVTVIALALWNPPPTADALHAALERELERMLAEGHAPS